jgi:hypothetical protein
LAAALRNEPGLEVNLLDGDRGEFTVSVGGKVVARKGESLPSVEEIVDAVKKAAPTGAAV